MCNCGQDGLKVENQKLYAYDAGYDEDWYEIEAAKFCPFCGKELKTIGDEMNKHETLRNKLESLNETRFPEAAEIVTEVLQYLMDVVEPKAQG